MMQPSITHLPMELHFAIIDFLRSDMRCLAQCSAVCASWRLRCYKYKFATVPLAWGSVQFFNALIHDEFSAPAIIPSVRSIYIYGPPVSISAWDTRRMAAIQDTLSALTSPGNITHFGLRNLIWSVPPSLSLDILTLGTVSTLELLQVNVATREELVMLFSNFKGLRHLVLEDVECVTPPLSNPKTLPSGSYGMALRCPQDFSLRKRIRWDSDAMEAEDRTVSATELADLTVLMSGTHYQVSDILPAFKGSLHRLQLATQAIHTYPDVALSNLDLSYTTSLKQLSLGSSKRVLSLLPWVPLILNQLPATIHPTLTHLQFAFASSRQFHLDRPLLLVISDILARPHFQSLQTIHFVVFDATGDRDLLKIVRHTICEALESWYTRGVLAFSFTRV